MDWNYLHIFEDGVETSQDRLTSAGREFTELFAAERYTLQAQERRQTADCIAFRNTQARQWREFHLQKACWEDSEQLARSLYVEESDILHLDIGGQGFLTVSRRTLLKHQDSALAAMFSGRHAVVTHKNAIFIDRNFEPFANVVSYLRSGRRPRTAEADREFREEMDYWGIPLGEGQQGKGTGPLRLFDVRLSSQALAFESDLQTARKAGTEHAVLFAAMRMTAETNYVEFRVCVQTPSGDSCELHLGLVNPCLLPPKAPITHLWTQAPNSYFWDACDNKLIRTDRRCRSTECEDYSCFCSSEECTFGVHYDPRLQSVSFYKDGVDQGTAFSCVESGLTPVLDLWFDAGEVQILQTNKPGED